MDFYELGAPLPGDYRGDVRMARKNGEEFVHKVTRRGAERIVFLEGVMGVESDYLLKPSEVFVAGEDLVQVTPFVDWPLYDSLGNRNYEDYRAVLLDVARGLADLHGSGIIHKDVKGNNIFLDKERGRGVLFDFDLSTWPFVRVPGYAVRGTMDYAFDVRMWGNLFMKQTHWRPASNGYKPAPKPHVPEADADIALKAINSLDGAGFSSCEELVLALERPA